MWFRVWILWMLICAQPVLAAKPGFVDVPGGKLIPFWLKPQKKGQVVYQIRKFQSQIHQVTLADYLEFLKKNEKWRKSQVSPLFADSSYLDQFKSDLEIKPGHSLNSPVTSVSWFAAQAYCEALGARLPTTQEWEYMAAASEKKKDANKDPAFLERILTWYGQTKTEFLPEVGSIYRNIYGIHDAHGLVWEWVSDFNSNTSTGESREDSSFDRNMFCGAGSINAGDKENYAAFMRFGFRGSLKGNSNIWNLGFRCVKGK